MNIVLLTNILTPYRKFFYDNIYNYCQKNQHSFCVLVMAESEPGRHWRYDDLKTAYTKLMPGKFIRIIGVNTIINFGLKKELKLCKPDVVVAGGGYDLLTVWIAVYYSGKLKYRTFFWSESHDDEERQYRKFKLAVREILRKRILGRFDGFWFAGEKSRNLLSRYASTSAAFIFVPNLVDSKKFSRTYSKQYIDEARKQYINGQKIKIFFCPARLHSAKGIIEFLKLFSNCSKKNEAIILLAGDGELEEEIQKFADEKHLPVKLLGYRNEEEIAKLYALSDVFLLPSKSDPNPLSCIEACWSGLPLLLSIHVGNHPEIVKNGVNGYVFDYEKENDAIKKIDNIISNDDDWMRTASAFSKKVAIDHFDPLLQTNRIMDEFVQCIIK